MKQLIDAAGLRTPGHEAAETVAGVWAAAERLGFRLIVKPIAGAGSADTYRADSADELDAILPMLRGRAGAVREHLLVPPAPASHQAA